MKLFSRFVVVAMLALAAALPASAQEYDWQNGPFCWFESYGRGVGTIPALGGGCAPGHENNAGLCYRLCKVGYKGIGPVCWADKCPASHPTPCGAGCAKSKLFCDWAVTDQVLSTLELVVSVASNFASGGAATLAGDAGGQVVSGGKEIANSEFAKAFEGFAKLTEGLTLDAATKVLLERGNDGGKPFTPESARAVAQWIISIRDGQSASALQQAAQVAIQAVDNTITALDKTVGMAPIPVGAVSSVVQAYTKPVCGGGGYEPQGWIANNGALLWRQENIVGIDVALDVQNRPWVLAASPQQVASALAVQAAEQKRLDSIRQAARPGSPESIEKKASPGPVYATGLFYQSAPGQWTPFPSGLPVGAHQASRLDIGLYGDPWIVTLDGQLWHFDASRKAWERVALPGGAKALDVKVMKNMYWLGDPDDNAPRRQVRAHRVYVSTSHGGGAGSTSQAAFYRDMDDANAQWKQWNISANAVAGNVGGTDYAYFALDRLGRIVTSVPYVRGWTPVRINNTTVTSMDFANNMLVASSSNGDVFYSFGGGLGGRAVAAYSSWNKDLRGKALRVAMGSPDHIWAITPEFKVAQGGYNTIANWQGGQPFAAFNPGAHEGGPLTLMHCDGGAPVDLMVKTYNSNDAVLWVEHSNHAVTRSHAKQLGCATSACKLRIGGLTTGALSGYHVYINGQVRPTNKFAVDRGCAAIANPPSTGPAPPPPPMPTPPPAPAPAVVQIPSGAQAQAVVQGQAQAIGQGIAQMQAQMQAQTQARGPAFAWLAVAAGGRVPASATIGGQHANGTFMHACRANMGDGMHPGKVWGGQCYVGWGGQERAMPNFEVLYGDPARVTWVAVSNGQVPANATIGGQHTNGTFMQVCRANMGDGLHPGKVWGGKCYVGWGGQERAMPGFEVLVHGSAPAGATAPAAAPVPASVCAGLIPNNAGAAAVCGPACGKVGGRFGGGWSNDRNHPPVQACIRQGALSVCGCVK